MHVSDDASVKKHLSGLLDMEEELVELKKNMTKISVKLLASKKSPY